MADLGQSGGRICGVKRCRRVARQAFDVWNPWPDGKPENRRHYEVCDKHAAEFWPYVPGYVEKETAVRIAERVMPCA
jgi:hypothetical protein